MDFNEILRPKEPAEKETIISVTATTQLLLQVNCDAYEAREQGVECGLIQEGMNNDEAIACPLAYYIFSGYEEKYSPYLVSTFLLTYCRIKILSEFIHFYTQFAKIEKEYFLENLKKFNIETYIDIKSIAEKATELNLKKSTPNPFKDPYNQIWVDNFN